MNSTDRLEVLTVCVTTLAILSGFSVIGNFAAMTIATGCNDYSTAGLFTIFTVLSLAGFFGCGAYSTHLEEKHPAYKKPSTDRYWE